MRMDYRPPAAVTDSNRAAVEALDASTFAKPFDKAGKDIRVFGARRG